MELTELQLLAISRSAWLRILPVCFLPWTDPRPRSGTAGVKVPFLDIFGRPETESRRGAATLEKSAVAGPIEGGAVAFDVAELSDLFDPRLLLHVRLFVIVVVAFGGGAF